VVTGPACLTCGGVEYTHMIDTAHGISGTYMDKTERFICRGCLDIVHCWSPNAAAYPFRYEKVK